MGSISFELQNLHSHRLKTLQRRPCQNKMRLSRWRDIGASLGLAALCQHAFIVSKSRSALPHPHNTADEIHFQIQHVERRLLEGPTGRAAESAGERKAFYSATAFGSRLSLPSVQLSVSVLWSRPCNR